MDTLPHMGLSEKLAPQNPCNTAFSPTRVVSFGGIHSQDETAQLLFRCAGQDVSHKTKDNNPGSASSFKPTLCVKQLFVLHLEQNKAT